MRWVTYSPSGQYIASLTLASTVHIWDAQSGDALVNVTNTQTDTLRALLCFTADEKALAYLENDKIVLQRTGKLN